MKIIVSRKRLAMVTTLIFSAATLIICSGCPQQTHPFKALETVTAEDGSTWERVVDPGFGNENNISVAALGEYMGSMYATTRNDDEGTEIWRTSGDIWEQVQIVPGEKNGIYGNTMLNNLWSKMIIFNGKLYVGFSSGLQGTVLHSSGCEIWRFDGNTWEPVVSDQSDIEEEGTITGINGCADNDGDITAEITDGSKNWAIDQWAGGVLQITKGEGAYRRFDIISNTAETLTIQQNETAGDYEREYTVCGSKRYTNSFPAYEYDLGPIAVGDSYQIGMGSDENGFGDYWNKTITEMLIFDNKLYVSTGLNYDYGAQVWYTEDGDTWQVTLPPNSFGNYHSGANYYKDSRKAVSSSISDIGVSDVSGEPVLYAAGTGTSCSNCPPDNKGKGQCARMARLTDTGWELIVDSADVDDNETGTNENGFGDGMSCTLINGNFMAWNIQHFKDKLFAGTNSLAGTKVLYAPSGLSDIKDDGSWYVSVGTGTDYPVGFDGELLETDDASLKGTYRNIACNLFVYGDVLYAGVIAQKSDKVKSGTPLWKTSDGTTWTRVTDDSFGQTAALAFEGFATFNGALYVGINMASSSQSNEAGATIYRLAQ